MKYLVVVRGFNEADNNTPSDEIWAKITDIEPSDLPKYEKIYTSEFENDYEHGVSVDFYPINEIDETWAMIIFIKGINKLITAVEGTGDNLLDEDIAEGLKDYMMTSIYKVDGEDVELEDGGQMMTSEYIKDLEPEEIAHRLLDFWGYTSDSLDWVIVDY